jgi:RNA polymerase sigma factor (TIGR02999 family)
MADSTPKDVTQLLSEAAAGDSSAAVRLLPMVYDELRKLAASRMLKTPPGQTLQPTALVHEAYMRIVGDADSRFAGRKHFFFAAARAMRDILVEQARRRASLKRGGEHKRVEFIESGLAIQPPSDDVVALAEALKKLEVEDPEKAELVNLRYFAGLTTDETADVLGVSAATIERKWRFARAWLRRELGENASPPGVGDA